jgi:hypothetical protein
LFGVATLPLTCTPTGFHQEHSEQICMVHKKSRAAYVDIIAVIPILSSLPFILLWL